MAPTSDSLRPTVIVGTARCGSTLLSNLVSKHPQILSLSEFFESLRPYVAPTEPLTGGEFWSVLSAPRAKYGLLVKNGLVIDEFLYPMDGNGRFKPADGIPPILLWSLPHLTGAYEDLYDRIEKFVREQPMQHVRRHYYALFGWLCAEFGRRVYVERSGGSLQFVDTIRGLLPHARFIHIVRDGRETAMSMSRHHAVRLEVIGFEIAEALGWSHVDITKDPFERVDRSWMADVQPELRRFLPEYFDPGEYKRYRMLPSRFGQFWSSLISIGLGSLRAVPYYDLLTIRYEDLMQQPGHVLHQVFEFIGVDALDDLALKHIAAEIRDPRRPTWPSLESAEASRLAAACAPGMDLLSAEAEITY